MATRLTTVTHSVAFGASAPPSCESAPSSCGASSASRAAVITVKLIEALAQDAKRDTARLQLCDLRSKTEQILAKMAVKKEFEAALESSKNERNEACSELSSLREEVNVLHPKCELLEQSNKDLQSALAKVQTQAENKREVSILETRQQQDPTMKDDLLESRDVHNEVEYEITKLKASAAKDNEELQTEITKLKAERGDLADKLHRETVLTSDYASAAKEQAKKIQMLEKDVHDRDLLRRQERHAHQSHLNKLAQKIKKLEATVQGAAPFRAEASSLGAAASALKRELAARSTEVARAREEAEQSRAKILDLQDALQSMQAALKAVSSRSRPSPRNGPNGHGEKRQQMVH